MQVRHLDRRAYFAEEVNTSENYYINYLTRFVAITKGCRVLEIGCGEGGNLLPFVKLGCNVSGIDRSSTRINQAIDFFSETGYEGEFIAVDFFEWEKKDKGYDIILIHDVIEHIERKDMFVDHLKDFLSKNGIVFWGFPAWQMPFGGHQQICHSKICSLIPFIHLLPCSLYKVILKCFGENDDCVNELIDIKRCKMTIESFESLMNRHHYKMLDRCLWLVNPHYKQKFHLTPRKLSTFLAQTKYLRNYFSTSCFYITRL